MKLRFFCDLCGTEVPRNTIRCPTCGRYFTAIQCPRCGFRGEEKDFFQGCPKCGYMKIHRAGGSAKAGSSGRGDRAAKKRTSRRQKKAIPASRTGSSPVIEETPMPAAPVFVYRLIGVALALILIGLLLILFLR